MQTVVRILLMFAVNILCVPPRCSQSQVNVETDEVIGYCCLHVKNEIDVHQRDKVVQRFLDNVHGGSCDDKRMGGVHTIIYPDDEVKYKRPNEENRNGYKNRPNKVVTTSTVKTIDADKSTAKNVSIGNRVNVDLPDTCTKGYRKNINGQCVEVFDDIE